MASAVFKFGSTAQWVQEKACDLTRAKGVEAIIKLSGPINSGTLTLVGDDASIEAAKKDITGDRILNNLFRLQS